MGESCSFSMSAFLTVSRGFKPKRSYRHSKFSSIRFAAFADKVLVINRTFLLVKDPLRTDEDVSWEEQTAFAAPPRAIPLLGAAVLTSEIQNSK